jgi:hypothetical protein
MITSRMLALGLRATTALLLALVAPASACDGHKHKSKVVKCSSYTTVTGTTKTTCRTR